jgi:single-strand DNA-binding protein
MLNLNKVFLIGNAGADAKIVSQEGKLPVAKFCMATSNYIVKDNQKQEVPEWHNIVVLGRSAQNAAKFVKKGMLISIEGALRTRMYQDNEGKNYPKTEIVAEKIQWLKPIPEEIKSIMEK